MYWQNRDFRMIYSDVNEKHSVRCAHIHMNSGYGVVERKKQQYSCEAWQYTRLDTRISNKKGQERENEPKWRQRGKRKEKKTFDIDQIWISYGKIYVKAKSMSFSLFFASLVLGACSRSHLICLVFWDRARTRLFRSSRFVQTNV